MNVNTLLPDVGGSLTSFFRKKKGDGKTPPFLTSAVRFPHLFQFVIRLAPNAPYEVLVSSDLRSWESLSTGTAAAESVEFVDSDAAKVSYRFYRVFSNQLPSKNVVGYVSVSLAPGFSMIANPLNAPNNSVAALFSNVPEGTTLSKFDTRVFRLNNSYVKDGKWSNPGETINPGEGAILFNPTTDFRTIYFVGEVMQGNLFNPIPAGFSIRSSLVPQPGRLNTDLEFPLGDGDVIHIFDKDRQEYAIHPYPSKLWDSNPPLIGVGESFWIGKASPGNWVRNFVIEG
jgi:hypothetical protein